MASQAIELERDAFMQMVTEEHLQVEGPSGGWLYTGKKGKNGWELYKTPNNPWWIYQARRVLTSPAGGGALAINISVPAGVVARLQAMYLAGPASNTTLIMYRYDEDGAIAGILCNVAAGVSRTISLPIPGATSTASSGVATTMNVILGPAERLQTIAAASLQNETLTVGLVFIMSDKQEPTWATTGSAAGATLADSTISAANTWQQVVLP